VSAKLNTLTSGGSWANAVANATAQSNDIPARAHFMTRFVARDARQRKIECQVPDIAQSDQ
jgi:hypothetical protein